MAKWSWVLSLGNVVRARRPAVWWGLVQTGKPCHARMVSCEKTGARIHRRDCFERQRNILLVAWSSGSRAQELSSRRVSSSTGG